jgi:PAS domain S-box-containing protein
MDTAPVAFVVVLDDVVVYANSAAGQLFDSDADAIVGTKFSDWVADDSKADFRKLRRTVLRRFGAIDRQTIALHTIEGSELIVEMSANPVDHGDNLALQLMLHDRTAQRLAEDQLQKTKVDYQMFFERIPVALYRSKPDGRIVDVNQAAIELLGAKDRSEIVGTNAADYYTDSANRDQLAGMLGDVGVVAGYEWQMIRRDGALRWIRDTSRFIETSDGRFFEGAMVDVTSRRDIEDELWSRAVQQEAAASIGQLALETEDVEAVCETLSEIVCEVLGASAVAIMRRDVEGRFIVVGESRDIGIDPSLLSGLADRAHMSAAPVVLGSESDVRTEAPALLDRGFRSCVALMIPGKEIEFGTLVLLSDTEREYSSDDMNFLYSITNVLAAAVDRASAYERLEALVQSKDAFVASVSHELRTPLTVVSGLAHELSQRWRTLSDSEMEEFMSMLVGQSLDMADLIEDLLVAARANIGNVTVRVVPVDVSREVDNVLAGFERQTDKTIRATIESATIEADPTRFRQILRNLISNAIRYGGRDIEVVGSARAGVYAIEVRDDGDPISMSDRDRIFEPYERAHDTSGRPGSVGLGLAVSRTLAELMRGSLTYHHDGQSVFRLELPGDGGLDDAPNTGIRGDEAFRALGSVGTSRIGVDVGSVQ